LWRFSDRGVGEEGVSHGLGCLQASWSRISRTQDSTAR
jgi:hypothetical protein